MQNLTFYPQVGSMVYNSIKKLPLYDISKKEEAEKKFKDISMKLKKFKEERLKKYLELKRSNKYYFSIENYKKYIEGEDFDIKSCLLEYIIKKDKQEREMYKIFLQKKQQEKEDYLKYLKEIIELDDEDDDFYFEDEPFISESSEEDSDSDYY